MSQIHRHLRSSGERCELGRGASAAGLGRSVIKPDCRVKVRSSAGAVTSRTRCNLRIACSSDTARGACRCRRAKGTGRTLRTEAKMQMCRISVLILTRIAALATVTRSQFGASQTSVRPGSKRLAVPASAAASQAEFAATHEAHSLHRSQRRSAPAGLWRARPCASPSCA